MLVIGLDAADRQLIDRWCTDGSLPNLSSMRVAGTWRPMQTTAEHMHVSAWPSLYTGVAPDHHGLYHAFVMRDGEQAPVRPDPAACPHPWVWKTLSDHGKSCIVADAFMSCPVDSATATQLVDWGTWTHFHGTRILPQSLAPEIERRFGTYPAEDHSRVGMTPPPDPLGFRERLLEAVEHKTEVLLWLMRERPWDFFLGVFAEPHPAGHYFWHYQDSDYPSHQTDADPALQSALRDVYVAIDTAIGRLAEAAGPETVVLVTSGDGMGPNYSGSHLLKPMLTKTALLNAPGEGGAGGEKRDLLATLRNLIPRELRAVVSRNLLPGSVNQKLSMRWKTTGTAWERTKVFPIDNANEGFLRVNLRGRDPQGTVPPGDELEALCNDLRIMLDELVNPANGIKAASSVELSDQLFDGPLRRNLPDLLVHWNPQARITTSIASPALGTITHECAGYELSPFYTGNHHPRAFSLATGPGIAGGQRVEGAHILDFAPSILDFFGIAHPANMSGRADLFAS